MIRGLVAFSALAEAASSNTHLKVSGTDLTYGGQRVVLNGVNQPWLAYGSDFGGNQSNGAYCTLKNDYLTPIAKAGGNSIRFWLFVEGESIPAWDSAGKVISTDAANTLIEDVRKYVRTAASMNILVFFCLWNGANANKPSSDYWNMIREESGEKLQTFIDKALS